MKKLIKIMCINKIIVLSFVFIINPIPVQAQTQAQIQAYESCNGTGAMRVWINPITGELVPSAEAACAAIYPNPSRPTFTFHSTATLLNSNLEVQLGTRRCLVSIDGVPPPPHLRQPSTTNLPGGSVGQVCRLPTSAEDYYESEELGGGDCSLFEPTTQTSNHTPNPCNIATGNKFRVEADFNHSSFGFVRYYNSLAPNNSDPAIGNRWTHSFQRRILRSDTNFAVAILASASGKTESFRFSNFVETIFENGFANPDNNYILEASADSEYYYRVIHPSGDEDQFHIDGRIAFSQDTKGQRTNYDYEELDNNQYFLTKVTDHYGHIIQFEYELVREQSDEPPAQFAYRRINKVTDQFGAEYLYEYDDINNLTAVIYPDTTPGDESDNPRKTYHYENQDYPEHLTGITDENGERYGNFAYDDDGKAILSELGITTNSVGQEKIELDFQ